MAAVLAQRTADESTIAPGGAACDVGLATTPATRHAASRLVHDRYVASGYMKPNPTGTRVGRHPDSTRVFVARQAAQVVATVSLVEDSADGLPCDALYRDELGAMRAMGQRLAEVSALAVADETSREGFRTVRALIQVVALYAVRIARLDALVITVNPRHTAFYERRLGFERFGPVRSYDAVNGAPAVPLRLDLRRALVAARGDAFATSLLAREEADRIVWRLRRDLGDVRLKSLHSIGDGGAIRPLTPTEVW